MIKFNNSGFVEVKTDGVLMILTHDEYLHAMKRGDSVIRNRKLKKADRLATERAVILRRPSAVNKAEMSS